MKYRFNGRIKAITFKDARVSVLLENTTFMSNEGDWKQWVDWKLIEGGKYKKGEVWVSAFEQSAPEVFQACKMIEKGSEVELEIYKGDKDFLNINNIQLKVPEKDINADLEPPTEETPSKGEPSSDQRDPDSPEAQAERMVDEMPPKPKSTTVDIKEAPKPPDSFTKEDARRAVKQVSENRAPDKEILIIRQTCVKAVGSGMRLENENDAEVAVAIARRLEKFVLTGE